MRFDKSGRELPDATPVEMPAGFRRPEPLSDMIARMVKDQVLNQYAASRGVESFEEANDFDIPDEDITSIPSQYELHEMEPDRFVKGGEDADDKQTNKEAEGKAAQPVRGTKARDDGGAAARVREPERDEGEGPGEEPDKPVKGKIIRP